MTLQFLNPAFYAAHKLVVGLLVAGVSGAAGVGYLVYSAASPERSPVSGPTSSEDQSVRRIDTPGTPQTSTGTSNTAKPDDKKPSSPTNTATGQSTTTTPSPASPSPSSPSPAPGPTPPSPPPSLSGEAIPLGDLPGWKQIFADDFTIDAPTGSWATTSSQTIVYTGDYGGKWRTYPDGWPSTYTSGQPGYQPGQVLSVHDGVLDFHLRDINGLPSGANPSPVITGTSQYQTYGRYAARFRVDAGLSNYHAAWLLWPTINANGGCAESDFPEGRLNSTVSAFAHNSTVCSDYTVQDSFHTSTRFDSGWHTYVQEWSPGLRKYYIDGQLIGTSTTRVWSQDLRWQLQTEPKGNDHANGHLHLDWVVVWSYNP